MQYLEALFQSPCQIRSLIWRETQRKKLLASHADFLVNPWVSPLIPSPASCREPLLTGGMGSWRTFQGMKRHHLLRTAQARFFPSHHLAFPAAVQVDGAKRLGSKQWNLSGSVFLLSKDEDCEKLKCPLHILSCFLPILM